MNTRRISVAIAALSVALAAVGSRSQELTGTPVDPALQRAADDLQGCLESAPSSTRLESTTTMAGAVVDATRVTHWGASRDGRCNRDRCAAPDGLRRVVDLAFEAGEPHASWSADDRARHGYYIAVGANRAAVVALGREIRAAVKVLYA